jgi:hypothetical protein
MMTKKDFDCVEMQDRAALRIYEALKGKTRDEELAYWRQRNEEALAAYPHLRKDIPSRVGPK